MQLKSQERQFGKFWNKTSMSQALKLELTLSSTIYKYNPYVLNLGIE